MMTTRSKPEYDFFSIGWTVLYQVFLTVCLLLIFYFPVLSQLNPIENFAVCVAKKAQHFPVVTKVAAGGVIVAWRDARNENYDVYAQMIDIEGTMLWQPDGIPVCNAEKEQITPTAVSTEAGKAIVIWSDARGDDYDIYMQQIPE